MHLKRSSVNQKSRPDKLLMLFMITQNMTHILTQETLDAFAKFLHAVDVLLLHPPRAVLGVRRSRLELLDAFFDLIVPRNVRDEVLDRRKSTHRLDRNGPIERDRV